jgi:type I restriction enzyme, S subunit
MAGRYRAYPEYKDSGEEWLGAVPKEWLVIQIKHLSIVKRGASPRPIDDEKYFDDEGEYAWTRIADVTASDVYLESAPQKLSSLGSSLSVKLNPGALFLSIAGTVGKPCITAIKACIHDGFVYFPELKIPSKFLFYVFAGEQA